MKETIEVRTRGKGLYPIGEAVAGLVREVTAGWAVQPQIIEEIHRRYFEAGADIVTT